MVGHSISLLSTVKRFPVFNCPVHPKTPPWCHRCHQQCLCSKHSRCFSRPILMLCWQHSSLLTLASFVMPDFLPLPLRSLLLSLLLGQLSYNLGAAQRFSSIFSSYLIYSSNELLFPSLPQGTIFTLETLKPISSQDLTALETHPLAAFLWESTGDDSAASPSSSLVSFYPHWPSCYCSANTPSLSPGHLIRLLSLIFDSFLFLGSQIFTDVSMYERLC